MSVQLAEERPQDRLAVEVGQRRVAKRVERADVGRVRMPQHGQRQRGHHRLVQVDQVELLLLQQALGLQVRAQRQRDAGDRAVGWNGHHAPDAMHGRVDRRDRLGLVVRRRRDDMHLVPEGEELLGQVGHVLGNAAWVREVVRGDERELHRSPLLTRAARLASASGRRSIAPDGWRYGTPGVWPQPELAPARPAWCRPSALNGGSGSINTSKRPSGRRIGDRRDDRRAGAQRERRRAVRKLRRRVEERNASARCR